MPAKDKATAVAKPSAATPFAAVDRPRRDVEVTVCLELGRATCTLDELLQFGENSVFELDRTVGEPIDIVLGGRICARGEVVTVGEHFGVRVTEIVDAGVST